MNKKIILLILAFMLTFSVCASAQGDVTVTLNGQVLAFDVPAQLINQRTMVPMRAIFENLGAKVNWVEEHQLIIATKGTTFITMQIGSDAMLIQDVMTEEKEVITLDVPPQLVDSRTLVPVRAIAEGLDATVDWEDETWTVVITTN